MIATIGFLVALECIKFDFGGVSAPDPAGGGDSAPPNPLADFRDTLLLRGRGEEETGGEGRDVDGGGSAA